MFTRSNLVSSSLLALSFGCASQPVAEPSAPVAATPSPPSQMEAARAEPAKAAPAGTTPATPRLLASFEQAKGALPEGLALRNGFAYVGFAPTGQIVRTGLEDGVSSVYANLPTPAANKGFMTGLEFDGEGRLYAALASFVDKPQAGIYRVAANGTETNLFAKHDKMKFPNGIALDGQGGLFVTDSGAGAVFKVSPSGTTTLWSTSELLKGDKDFCGKGVGASFDIGANGVTRIGNTLFVANNDRATIIRIPIQADNSAGTASLLAGSDCDNLGGADGLAADSSGNLILATNRLNRIVRVSASGKVEALASGGDLDFPASVALSGPDLVATNFALFNAMSGKPGRPGLLKLPYAP